MSSQMSLTDDPVAFPTLDDAELAVLDALGSRREVTVGEYLYREGDTTYDFYVIRSAAAEIVLRTDDEARIDVRTNSEITALDGDRTLTSIHLTIGGCDAMLPCVALFSFIGTDPAAEWLSGCAALDEHGFVLTDRSLGEAHLAGRWEALGLRPLPFETSYPGCSPSATCGRARSSESRPPSAKGRPQFVPSTSTSRSLTERRLEQ